MSLINADSFRPFFLELVNYHMSDWHASLRASLDNDLRYQIIKHDLSYFKSIRNVYCSSRQCAQTVFSYFVNDPDLKSKLTSHNFFKIGQKSLYELKTQFDTPTPQAFFCILGHYGLNYHTYHVFVIEKTALGKLFIYQSRKKSYNLKQCMEELDKDPISPAAFIRDLAILMGNERPTLRAKIFKKYFHPSQSLETLALEFIKGDLNNEKIGLHFIQTSYSAIPICTKKTFTLTEKVKNYRNACSPKLLIILRISILIITSLTLIAAYKNHQS
jgi:hypothetical protein